MFVNYSDFILNYVSSIRAYFGLESYYRPNDDFSRYLESKKPERIYLILIDAMGSRLIERKLSEDSFFRKHLYKETSTVFPPTTTAATTSVIDGKSPNQNAWLGWSQYFEDMGDSIIPFRGMGYYSNRAYGEPCVYRLLPFKSTVQELFEIGVMGHEIYPSFRFGGCMDVEEFTERIVEHSYTSPSKYVYCYWDKYDSMLHKYGVDAKECDNYLKHIDDLFNEASKKLNKGTMMVIVADHGQIDVKEEINVRTSELNEYLRRPIELEPRATAFFVKDEYMDSFEAKFKELYQEHFILLTKQQVLDTKLFGLGDNHPRFEEFIGDFLAIAKSDKQFVYRYEGDNFKMIGSHAGCLEEERMIPIITYYQE